MSSCMLLLFLLILYYFGTLPILSIYLPELDENSHHLTTEKNDVMSAEPSVIVKISTKYTKSNLALTTVIVMGSAGLSVIYVLCIFIICLRHEDRSNENLTNLVSNRPQTRLSPSANNHTTNSLNNNYQQEIEPLMLQLSISEYDDD